MARFSRLLRRTARLTVPLALSACTSTDGPAPSRPTYIQLTPNPVALIVGATQQLQAVVLDQDSALFAGTGVTFTSQDAAVATVSVSGLVTAVAAGTTTVMGHAGAVVGEVAVTVTVPIGAVTMTADTASLAIGQATVFSVTVRDIHGAVVTGAPLAWTSSDPAVASVTSGGSVLANKSGVVWIRAQVGGVADSAHVWCYAPFPLVRQPTVALAGSPWGLAIAPNGMLYTTLSGATGLRALSLPALVPGTIATVGSLPLDVSFSADGQKAFVLNSGSNNLSVVTLATMTQDATWPIGETPWRIVTSADGSKLFVTTTSGTVHVLNAATGASIATFAGTSGASNGIALSSDGSRLYASGFLGGQVTEINTATHQVLRTLPLTEGLQEVVLSGDGSRLYVGSEGGRVKVISVATFAVVDSLPVSDVFGMALTPDEQHLITVSGHTGTLTVVDLGSHAAVTTIALGAIPRRVRFAGTTMLVSSSAGIEVFK